jgi:hypothetical protein
MGWPKGVSRKELNARKEGGNFLTDQQKVDLVFPPQKALVFHGDVPDLVLTVRRITAGSFAGLWELCKVNPDGTIKVLTDANTKMIVANLARNEVAKCGA